MNNNGSSIIFGDNIKIQMINMYLPINNFVAKANTYFLQHDTEIKYLH